jgi:hypothetical protein
MSSLAIGAADVLMEVTRAGVDHHEIDSIDDGTSYLMTFLLLHFVQRVWSSGAGKTDC